MGTYTYGCYFRAPPVGMYTCKNHNRRSKDGTIVRIVANLVGFPVLAAIFQGLVDSEDLVAALIMAITTTFKM